MDIPNAEMIELEFSAPFSANFFLTLSALAGTCQMSPLVRAVSLFL